MKQILRIAVLASFVLLAYTVTAQQTTSMYPVQAAYCQAYAASYTCTLPVTTPQGASDGVWYSPFYSYRLNPNGVSFQYSSTLRELGVATVTASGKTLNGSRTLAGSSNRQGYWHEDYYTETTDFTGQTSPYTGYFIINYTVTTRCCSSGRGASQHSTWTVTGGVMTLTQ